MSKPCSRFGVVIVDRYLHEHHIAGKEKGEYIAKVITNNRASNNRPTEWIFGDTPEEIDFYECACEEEAKLRAEKFNQLWWDFQLYMDIRKVPIKIAKPYDVVLGGNNQSNQPKYYDVVLGGN